MPHETLLQMHVLIWPSSTTQFRRLWLLEQNPIATGVRNLLKRTALGLVHVASPPRTVGDRHPTDLGLSSGVTAFYFSLCSVDGAVYIYWRLLALRKGGRYGEMAYSLKCFNVKHEDMDSDQTTMSNQPKTIQWTCHYVSMSSFLIEVSRGVFV